MQSGWIKCSAYNPIRMPNIRRYSSNVYFKSFTFPDSCVSISTWRPNDPKKLKIHWPPFFSHFTASRIRLITLELALKVFAHFVEDENHLYKLTDAQHKSIQDARNHSMIALHNFYKSEDIFLDLFEDEFNEMTKSNLNVEFLCMDSTILLPPTGTPLTGIGFTRRLPCGEVEKARRAIRVYFLLRRLCQQMNYEEETILPLTNYSTCISVDNILDLSAFIPNLRSLEK